MPQQSPYTEIDTAPESPDILHYTQDNGDHTIAIICSESAEEEIWMYIPLTEKQHETLTANSTVDTVQNIIEETEHVSIIKIRTTDEEVIGQMILTPADIPQEYIPR